MSKVSAMGSKEFVEIIVSFVTKFKNLTYRRRKLDWRIIEYLFKFINTKNCQKFLLHECSCSSKMKVI